MRDVRFPLRDMRFPSGLRVIIDEDHRSPLVAVVALVGSGSTSDPVGKEGLAHYVEHLAFRARPDTDLTVWAMLERAGAAKWNAETTWDFTVFHEVGPKEALLGLLRVESARMLAPVGGIAEDVAVVEREVVRDELREKNETGLIGSVVADLHAVVFPRGDPYARPKAGTHPSISSLTLDDARKFASQHYRPDNMTFVIVGDVDLTTVDRAIEQGLAPALRAGNAPRVGRRASEATPEPPAPPPGDLFGRQGGVEEPQLWVAWSLPRSLGTESVLDGFAAAVARFATLQARTKDHDIEGSVCDLDRGMHASMLICIVTLRDGTHPRESLRQFLDATKTSWSGADARTDWRATLNASHRATLTAMVLDAEDIVERGKYRAVLTHFTGDPTAYSHELKTAVAIEPDALRAFTERYLTPERARAVLVTPVSAAKPIARAGDVRAPRDDPNFVRFDPELIRKYIQPASVSGFRRATLANGLEVIAGRKDGLPVVTVGLSVHGGDATAKPPGVTQLEEDEAMPALNVLAGFIPIGGHFATTYGPDQTKFVVRGSSGNVTAMIKVLADWTHTLNVPAFAHNGFREGVVPATKTRETSPDGAAKRAFLERLFGKHPYGHVATAAELEQLDSDHANAWHARVAVGRNAVLAVVGEVDPDQVIGIAREAFESWAAGQEESPPAPATAPATRSSRPRFAVTGRPGATQTELRFGCLLPPPPKGWDARYDVVASLLGARMNEAVRVRLGASYGMHGRARTLRGGTAYLELEGLIDGPYLDKVLAALKDTLAQFERGEFGEGELDNARWRVARGYPLRFASTGDIVEAILDARNEGRDMRDIDGFPNELLAITSAAVQADFARCTAAPSIGLLGEEAQIQSAIANVWP